MDYYRSFDMLLLFFLSVVFGQEEPVPEPIIKPQKSTYNLPFLYTGNLRGFAGYHYLFSFKNELSYTNSSYVTTKLTPFRGILTQKRWILYNEDLSTQAVLDFLKGKEITCTKSDVLLVWKKRGNLLLSDQNITHLTNKLGIPGEYTKQTCTNEAKDEVTLLHPTSVKTLPNFQLREFSFRRGASIKYKQDGKDETALLVQEALFDLTRVQEYISEQKDKGFLYVDAGSFVDGWSHLPKEKLSLNRPASYETLKDLRPTALGIGKAELLDGAHTFFSEIKDKNLPYIATNWKTADPNLILPKSRTLSIATSQGTKNIAFLSILDPNWVDELPSLKKDNVEITEPIAAIQDEIERLNASSTPPDLILLLTTASQDVQEEIRRSTNGVALMLGDPTFATFRVVSTKTTLKNYDPLQKGAPITLPIDGLHELNIGFEDGTPTTIETKPVHIDDENKPNLDTQSIVNDIRAKIYPLFSSTILEPQGSGVKAQFSVQEWEKLLCESIRYYTDADSVVIRTLPPPPPLPGSINELTMLGILNSYDTLESHRITGTKLKTLLSKTKDINSVDCGAQAISLQSKGRSIESDQLYTIITTQKTRTQFDLDDVFQSADERNILDPQVMSIVQDEFGRAQTASLVILRSLRKLREEKGLENISSYLLKEYPEEKPSQTIIRIRKLGISTEQFGGMDNPKFASVPDTLANTASNSSLGNSLDLALDYTSQSYNQDLRLRTSFGTLNTGESEQEVQDDWNISSSISIPNIQLQLLGPLKWNMFTELLYDSEYTPTLQEDGTENPKQSDLSLSLGLTSLPFGIMKSVRISGFGNRDFSIPDTPRFEFGTKLEWESKTSIFENILWTSNGDVRLYADSPEDNESDLRLRAWAETRLSLPLTRYLALSVYGQTLIIKGRVESNNDLGVATNIGLALDILGIFSM